MAKLFVYGILKRGRSLDLTQHGGQFLGDAILPGGQLYGIGGGVGLRLKHDGVNAHGELFEIPDKLWPHLDRIEGNGYMYTREVVPIVVNGNDQQDAWVYVHNHPFEEKGGRKLEGNIYMGNY